MPAVNVSKLICKVPVSVKDEILQLASKHNLALSELFSLNVELYIKSHSLTSTSNSVLLSLVDEYIINNKSFLSEDLCSLSFYVDNHTHEQFVNLAKSKLRSVRTQAFHFACFMYFTQCLSFSIAEPKTV